MTPSEKGRVVHVNSSTLIMGVTGSGKSALLATLARYVWEQFHLVTLLYSSDGGGFPASVQALMQKGIMRVWRMRTRDLPDGSLSFETCSRACQGWWPQRINPKTGETPQGVQMVPPITEKYEMRCPNDHVVKVVPFQSMLTPTLCPTCKVLTDKGNMKVQKTSYRTKGFEDVGAVCYDGITSMLSWMMSDMGQRAGRLELKGEEAAIGGKVISGDMKFGGTTRSHVGFAQARAEDLILNSLGIPNLVVPPTFTSLTLETDDEGGLSIRGPKLAGRAKTDEAPQWFGNCLEAAVVKDERDRRQYRLYLSEFVDAAGVRHLVKNRADPGVLPPYLEDQALVEGHEQETAFENFNMGVFFRLLDEGLAKSMDRIAEQYPDAPGLPDGMAEVGEAAAQPVPPPTAKPAVAPGSPVGKPSAPVSGSSAKPAVTRPAPAASPRPVAATPAVVAPPLRKETDEAPTANTPPQVGTPAEVPASLTAAAAHTAPTPRPAGAWAPPVGRPTAPRPPASAPRVGQPPKA